MSYAVGERHPKSKLSSKEAQAIRRQYDLGGFTYRSLAQQFNVSVSAVSDVLNFRTWRHVALDGGHALRDRRFSGSSGDTA